MANDLQRPPADTLRSDRASAPEAVVVSVAEERFSVHKRLVESGAVRVRKVVHEEKVDVDELLSQEIVEVERVAVGREVEGEVAVRYEGDVMIIPIVEERLVVRTQRVLAEEIRITRRKGMNRSPQQAVVRREQAFIERLDPVSGEWRAIEANGESIVHPGRDPPES